MYNNKINILIFKKGVFILNFVVKINQVIGKRMFFVTLSALLMGFLFPIPEGLPNGKVVNIGLFSILTFFASTALNLDDFFMVLKKPFVPLWLLFLVHVGTPTISYIFSNIFYAGHTSLQLGILIGSILPMGVSTIVWTNMLGGDLALSIVSITLDTLIAPALIPFFLSLFLGKAVQLNYMSMVTEMVLMVSIPSILGMWLNKRLYKQQKLLSKINIVGSLIAKTCMFIVIYFNAAVVMPRINWTPDTMLLMCFMMSIVLSAFGLGYVGALPIKNISRGVFVSIVYNVGMRNINFGMVIAIAYFPPDVAIPATLMVIFQQPVAAIVGYMFNKYYPNK